MNADEYRNQIISYEQRRSGSNSWDDRRRRRGPAHGVVVYWPRSSSARSRWGFSASGHQHHRRGGRRQTAAAVPRGVAGQRPLDLPTTDPTRSRVVPRREVHEGRRCCSSSW
jgi:hypothetical protein